MTDPLDNQILEVLADRRRRRVCEVLAGEDSEFLPLERVAERVAAEADRADGLDPKGARTAAVELHHVHLPKLDEAGLLEYDHEGGAVHYEGHPVVESIAAGDFLAAKTRARTDAE